MKTLLPLLITAILLATAFAESEDRKREREHVYDATTRFIFHSVMEGLYEDGLSKADVSQILMKKGESSPYFHFIYACPICTPTVWALEAYKERPEQFYGMKEPGSTFGPGLSEALHAQLYSDDSQLRLLAINTLMQGWMDRRLKLMRLTKAEHTRVLKDLEEKRQQGMRTLESFRKKEHGDSFGVEQAAPGYVNLSECAVCNGAVGKPMKLPGEKPK